MERIEIAERLGPNVPVVIISNIVEPDLTLNGFQERSGCVFVGNWNHLPNRDAVLFFSREVLPLVSYA